MFLKDLNQNQQKLFLGMAKALIQADHKITDNEIASVAALANEMGQQEMIPDPSDELIKNSFTDKPSRVAAMLELIALSACDGKAGKEEESFINRIKTAFEMPDDDVNRYKAWVAKLYAVYGEAADFFN